MVGNKVEGLGRMEATGNGGGSQRTPVRIVQDRRRIGEGFARGGGGGTSGKEVKGGDQEQDEAAGQEEGRSRDEHIGNGRVAARVFGVRDRKQMRLSQSRVPAV